MSYLTESGKLENMPDLFSAFHIRIEEESKLSKFTSDTPKKRKQTEPIEQPQQPQPQPQPSPSSQRQPQPSENETENSKKKKVSKKWIGWMNGIQRTENKMKWRNCAAFFFSLFFFFSTKVSNSLKWLSKIHWTLWFHKFEREKKIYSFIWGTKKKKNENENEIATKIFVMEVQLDRALRLFWIFLWKLGFYFF